MRISVHVYGEPVRRLFPSDSGGTRGRFPFCGRRHASMCSLFGRRLLYLSVLRFRHASFTFYSGHESRPVTYTEAGGSLVLGGRFFWICPFFLPSRPHCFRLRKNSGHAVISSPPNHIITLENNLNVRMEFTDRVDGENNNERFFPSHARGPSKDEYDTARYEWAYLPYGYRDGVPLLGEIFNTYRLRARGKTTFDVFTSTDERETTRKKEIRNLFRFAGSVPRQLSGALRCPSTVR